MDEGYDFTEQVIPENGEYSSYWKAVVYVAKHVSKWAVLCPLLCADIKKVLMKVLNKNYSLQQHRGPKLNDLTEALSNL